MFIYVSCWPILAALAGKLIPAIGGGELERVLKVMAQALAVFLIQKIAQFGQDTFLAGPALQVGKDLRSNLFRELQQTQLLSLKKLSTGDITYRLTEDADRVAEVIYKTIQDTTPSILQLTAVFVYMCWLDWQLSLATILLAPIVATLVSRFGARVMIAAENSQQEVSNLAALLSESIHGLPLVRAFAAEDWLQNRFDSKVEKHRQSRYKTLKLLALQHPVVGFIEALGILTVFGYGALRIQAGGLSGEGFSSYVAGLLMLIDPISHLTINFNELRQGQASLKRLFQIGQQPKELEDKANAISLEKPKGHISFADISFRYQNQTSTISNFSLNVEPGKIVALVGPSGAGKSTLFSLLLRFNRVQKGYILLDGIDISNLKSNEIRKQIAIVPQVVNIFSGSIAEAISFGRNASENQIIKAAKLANAHDFIMSMPEGYSTTLDERGTNLSGGQLQRLAIARAVLGNPAVLLLDEATSALDAEAEEAVQQGIQQAMAQRTVLVIAHRLSTVQEADQIVVIENGVKCDSGTHDELMSRAGRYRDLCERQLIRSNTEE